MKYFLVAYDIPCPKRARKIRKIVYSYAIGGQKSVLEVPAKKTDIIKLIEELQPNLKNEDKVNIVQIDENPMLFGKADFINPKNGVILI